VTKLILQKLKPYLKRILNSKSKFINSIRSWRKLQNYLQK